MSVTHRFIAVDKDNDSIKSFYLQVSPINFVYIFIATQISIFTMEFKKLYAKFFFS